MYYKIVNKQCEVYNKLHEMRIEELKTEEENKKLVCEKVGLEWDDFLGYSGQQGFIRNTQYVGFVFKESEKVDLKIWKRHKEHNEVFIPNNKTKLGKEMSNFLKNLSGSVYTVVFDCLGLEHPIGRFLIPYVEIAGDVIILIIDEKIELNNDNIIEITSKEAKELLNKSRNDKETV